MKRSIAMVLALVLIISSAFVACSKKTTDEDTSAMTGLEDANNEVGFEEVEVTDEDGNTVTDANGNPVTTEVAVEYVTNKKGKTVAKVIDANGNTVTDKNGKEVTIKTDVKITTTKKSGSDETAKTTKETKTTESTTASTEKSAGTTNPELTTKKDYVAVPSTSASGNPVTFSSEDQQIIKNMLEVPYLYNASYEHADGVPIEIATHVAIWMAQKSGLTTTTYASGTVVIDLFRYFGQTVVNFKDKCNTIKDNDKIIYNADKDTFTISAFEDKKQEVELTGFEDLGGNNYYKITANVKGAGKIKKVTAIVQKNKLDQDLGFSIKALKWE